MYQADASGLFNVVSVTTWGQILDATASRAYEQVGDDHAPGRWQEHDAALADVGADNVCYLGVCAEEAVGSVPARDGWWRVCTRAAVR